MKTLLRSFAGGEITPELYGRPDLPKFQTGLATALNFMVLPHGPAARRAGFFFVNETKDSTKRSRLIPFVFSALQAIILEFGDLYVRFHDGDGTLLETAKAIVGIVGSTVEVTGHGWSTGDDVFIGTRFHRITVTDANHFTTKDLWGATTVPSGATAARVYTLTSPFTADQVLGLTHAQDSDVLTLTTTVASAQELSRAGATSWSFSTVSFTPTLAAPTGVTATATVAVATNLTTQTYVVTSVASDLVTESLASSSSSCSNNLSLAGNFNTITWSAATGAARYYVYKLRGGIYGFIGQTTGLSLVDDNIVADTTLSPPEANLTLNGAAGAYPSTAAHYERRRWFAGTLDKPQTVWATRNGTLSNLTSSIPSRDDDGMEFRIAATQQNAIRHLIPLADMIALTVGGEFRIYSTADSAVTPTSISIKPQGFSGAAEAQPVLTPQSALYVQYQGSRVRELSYDPNGTGYYRSQDVSLLATHLFNGYTISELAFTRAPEAVLWAVRSDGALLAMTYVPDQQVYGWHRHTTDGTFESVATIPEAGEDVLYAIVKRTINGRTVRYIERLRTRYFTDQEDAIFVDSALTYAGTAATTISGLWHLEGETVQILADGADVPEQTVTAGAITLTTAAEKVQVGLPYVSDLQTLPLAVEGAQAAGQGTMKNVNKVFLRVVDSALIKAGPTTAKLREYPARQVSDPPGSAPALRTFEAAMVIDPTWGTDGAMCVRQDRPLPLTVAAIALDVTLGG